MTVGVAAAAANGWLDGTFATATNFVKLHTADPGAAGATAAAVGDATRKQATMLAASAGAKAMTTPLPVWTNAATTETLSHISLWTAASAGTFNLSAALTTPQPWVATNTFTLNTLSVSVAPLAA